VGQAGSNSGTDIDPNDPATPFVASPSEARRLSRGELDRTLTELLGDTTGPAHQFLPEDAFGPYDNDYTLQLASAALVDSLERMATDVASRVDIANSALVPCTPASNDDADCFSQVVRGLLTRAFRRPIADAEVTP
jgi:hypothetical protein